MFKIFNKQAGRTFKAVDDVVLHTSKTVESYVAPVRQSILNRFPVLFALLVTFGIVATFLGLEQMILKFHILEQYPELILVLGISTLVFTGKLYKKLS